MYSRDPTERSDRATPDGAAASVPAAGGSVGRFRVHGMLGRGGMGIVLDAFDPKLDRPVAVKLLRPDAWGATTQTEQARLRREAQAMARLSHPNVVTVYDVGEVDGQSFLAMEKVDGTTLRAWQAQPRSAAAIIAMYLSVGRGLAAAHDAQLVHRDFKPENVLVGRDGRARVSDFGLVSSGAAITEADLRDTPLGTRMTVQGSTMGTPAYMAPEQWDGEDVDARADQFSFAVALWEAVYGDHPFAAAGTTAASLRTAVRTGAIRPPSRTARVPSWLRPTLERALARDRTDRWPTLDAMLDEMERRSTPSRVPLAIGAVTVVAAAAATVVFALRPAPAASLCSVAAQDLAGVWDETRATALRDAFAKSGNPRGAVTATLVVEEIEAYASAWRAARQAACEATHVHGVQSDELLDRRIACLDRHLADADALVDQLIADPTSKVVDKAVAATLRLVPVTTCDDKSALLAVVPPPYPAMRSQVDEVRALGARAKVLGELGTAKAGRQLADEAAAKAEELHYAPLLAEVLGRRSRLEQLTGDLTAAEASVRQAILAAADAHDDALAAQMWRQLIYYVGDLQARPAEALLLVPAAEAATRRAGNTPELVAHLRAAIARLLIADGKFVEGHALLLDVLAQKEALSGADSFDVARELTAIGNVLQDLGKNDESLRYLERSLAIWSRTFGPDHPDVIMQEANIANAYKNKGDLNEAYRRQQEVLARFAAALGPEHPHVASASVNLGNTLSSLGRQEESIAAFEKALAIQTKTLGPTHANVALVHGNLSGSYFGLRRFEEARQHAERALAIYEETELGDNPLAAYALGSLADALIELGRADEAVAVAERSLAIRERAKAGSDVIAETHVSLGHALLAAGRDRARGKKLLAEARAVFLAMGNEHGASLVANVDRLVARYR